MDDLKQALRGMVLRDLRPIEDKDGVRVGENCRITKEKQGYTIRFLKGTASQARKLIKDRLETANVSVKDGKDYTD